MKGLEAQGTTWVTWSYPNLHGGSYGEGDVLTICLEHVRAANNLRIRYDSERDGWSLLMDDIDPDKDTDIRDAIVREVAFVPSWCPKQAGPELLSPEGEEEK